MAFNTAVQPACLPGDADLNLVGNDDCWITGWGVTKGRCLPAQNYIHKIEVTVPVAPPVAPPIFRQKPKPMSTLYHEKHFLQSPLVLFIFYVPCAYHI